MFKLYATIFKELLLLRRDRAGLLVLFVMPAVLVLVVSLVQENVLKTIGGTSARILFVDKDQNSLGQTIEDQLRESGSLEIIKELDGRKIDEKLAREAIINGDFQFCVIIPEGITEAVRERARQLVTRSFSKEDSSLKNDIDVPDLVVYFDPTVRGGFRSAVVSSLNMAVLSMEISEKARIFSELLSKQMDNIIREAMGPYGFDESIEDIPKLHLDWSSQRLLEIKEKLASRKDFEKIPTSVQQNVPAWALFGIFFIVVPMAGCLIRERQDGTLMRLLTMPVSYLTLLSGKVIAYILVCLVQFVFIIIIGKLVLPFMGTSTLEMGSSPIAVIMILISSILAATGYGIMLGTIAKTYEQASMFGAISVVIAAALGGVMVPVYAMPKVMQEISAFSPLAWGLDAFLDIFVRQGDVKTVFPEVFLLLLFFVGTMLISWSYSFRQGRAGV
ncbi:MAG: ABC transporter permease [Deltaproteobacteria bacterium]|nr:ABC transporter permease [Deltaproteobacteria bacterium]